MKVVINRRPGGFGLSVDAMLMYAWFKGLDLTFWRSVRANTKKLSYKYEKLTRAAARKYLKQHYCLHTTTDGAPPTSTGSNMLSEYTISRSDEDLVHVVKKLGAKANGPAAELAIVDIPDNIQWDIHVTDHGVEWVAEQHRTWN